MRVYSIKSSRVLTGLFLMLLGGIMTPTEARADVCTSNCIAPGDYSLTVQSGGAERLYLLHVPITYTGDNPVSLVVDAHGNGLTADDQRTRSGQLAQSDKRGFIVVWPQGLNNGWNGMGCCSTSYELNVDDVGFIKVLIETIKRRANVDKRRVYMTGWSNGGGLTHRVACEAADVISAIAPVAHPINVPDQCHPSRPVTVVAFAGTADPLVNYYGAVPMSFQGARESLASWKIINKCSDSLNRTQLPGGSRDETYLHCRGGVKTGLVTVANGVHNLYPGTEVQNTLNLHGESGVDIAEYIWTHVFR